MKLFPRNNRIIFSFLMAAILSACQNPPSAEKRPQESKLLFDVPIRNLEQLASLRPGIDVMLNGEPIALLIDTGATYNIRFLRQAEFDPSKFESSELLMSRYFGGHGIMTLDPFHLSIDHYSRRIRNEGKAMLSPDYLEGIKGLLSPQSLEKGVTLILDFPGRRFLALKEDLEGAKNWAAKHYNHRTFQSLKSPTRRDRLWVLDGTIEGHEQVKVLLDTGAFISHFRSTYLKSTKANIKKTQVGDVWGNLYEAPIIMHQKFFFAGKKINIPEIVLDGPLANLEKDIQGIIGMDVLQQAIMIVPWYETGELLISFE